MPKQVEFINKKSGHKVVVGWEDAIRIRCLKRAGYVSAGEYVAPPEPEEPTPEATVGEIVDSIAEENPEPEQVPMVAIEATHTEVDPSDFVDLLDPPKSKEESDGEEIEEDGDAGSFEEESGEDDGSDDEGGDVPEVDLERITPDVGGEVSDSDSVGPGDADGGAVDSQEPA